jgi:polygalacturonase
VQRCTFNGSSHAARIKSQPSRGGEIQDIVYRDITLNNPGEAFDFEMSWDLRLERAPVSNVLTLCHNVQLINITGTARSLGTMMGYATQPIRDVKFVNCNITAQRGLRLRDAVDLDTTGLNAKVQQGPTIITGATAATQPANVPN